MADAATNHHGRTLVEEVTGWMQVYSDGTVERSGPPEAAPLLSPVPPYDVPLNGVTVHDITSLNPAVRLYLTEPSLSQHRRPILVHFHAGGFCVTHPSLSLYHNFYARLAVDTGVAAVVSVVLPLAPEHRLPAAIDAGYAALLWLREISTGANIKDEEDAALVRLRTTADFSRVFLIGSSSGGNLVHLVAAKAGETEPGALDPLKLAGGILLHPGFARAERSRSEVENPASPFLNLEMIDKLLALALPVGATKDHPYTCPMGQDIADLEALRVPPMMMEVAELDLLRDPQLEYGEAMRRAGKDVEVHVRSDVAHVFHLNWFAVESDPVTKERTMELVDAIKSFIDRH